VEGERIPAERCVALGLANRTAPADQLQSAALEWARVLEKRAEGLAHRMTLDLALGERRPD
jgi:enoyl-CoA hydratase/carnithine racemase